MRLPALRPMPESGPIAGRRRGRHERAGQRLGPYGAPAASATFRTRRATSPCLANLQALLSKLSRSAVSGFRFSCASTTRRLRRGYSL
jgi:hypothetical protein